MIHCFNPGHETAVLNQSRFYQPPVNQVRMQQELAFLPAWYADADDFIWLENPLPEDFQKQLKRLNPVPQTISKNEIPAQMAHLQQQEIALWGLSPSSIHFFEQLKQKYNTDWKIPVWNDKLRELNSRQTAQTILRELIANLPEIEENILPQNFHTLEEVENYIVESSEKQLLKSPYSSSGRGLLWLPPQKLAQSERQIIHGMLKKQAAVSIEKALDKQLDFSMHFLLDSSENIRFAGYSVFYTNSKGAYEKSRVAPQSLLLAEITKYVSMELLEKVKQQLSKLIKKVYSVHYQGNIGVDMLIYRSKNQYKIHPCVEINLRKSMGYLAIRLAETHLSQETQADFFVDYHSLSKAVFQEDFRLQQLHLLELINGKIQSGYYSLCPVSEQNHYHAYLISKKIN